MRLQGVAESCKVLLFWVAHFRILEVSPIPFLVIIGFLAIFCKFEELFANNQMSCVSYSTYLIINYKALGQICLLEQRLSLVLGVPQILQTFPIGDHSLLLFLVFRR